MFRRNAPEPRRRHAHTSKLRHRCPSGKLRYRDRREALTALRSTATERARGNARRHECRTYRCPECKGWHLTSIPSAAQLERRPGAQGMGAC